MHIAMVMILFSASLALAGDNPMKGPKGQVKPQQAALHPDIVGEGFMIGAYQRILSPVGGPRCRMHPSCSRYGRQCFEEFGLLTGYIMTCDRLMRCGRDEISLAPSIWVDGQKKCWDPVWENTWRKTTK